MTMFPMPMPEMPQEVIDAGVGVFRTECSFIPMPRERPLG